MREQSKANNDLSEPDKKYIELLQNVEELSYTKQILILLI